MITSEQRWDDLAPILIEAESLVSNAIVQRSVPLACESWEYFQRRAYCLVPLPAGDGEERIMDDLGPFYSDSPMESLSDSTDEEVGGEDVLGVIPLYEEDRSIGDLLWTAFLDRRSIMAYSPHLNSILVKMDFPETPLFKATNLLHEAGHALRAFQEGRAFAGLSRLPQHQQQEELELWQMEFDILSVLGSGPYLEAVQVIAGDLAWKFRTDLAEANRAALCPSTVTPLMPLLDDVVGKVPDHPQSQSNRLATLQLHVRFYACEILAWKFDWPASQLQAEKLAVMAQVFAQ